MRCKCKICGKELDTKFAYLKINDGKKEWYCSQAEYDAGVEAFQKKKKAENEVKSLVCEILGENDIVCSTLKTEWAEWNKVASNEKISSYLSYRKGYLTKTLARIKANASSTLVGRIKYLSAIIKNSIADYDMPTKKNNNRSLVTDIDMNIYTQITPIRRTRRALSELEDEL